MRGILFLQRAAIAALVAGCLVVGSAPGAHAAKGSTWLVGILADVTRDGKPVRHVETDENGQFVLRDLSPGHYEIAIDGKSLVAAMDHLAPAPEKKGNSSFGIGVGGSLFGGGSHGGSSSGGGRAGLGVNVPLGGSSTPHELADGGIETVVVTAQFDFTPGTRGHDSDRSIMVETPYCRDSAKQGMRAGFTMPEGGTAAIRITNIRANGEN